MRALPILFLIPGLVALPGCSYDNMEELYPDIVCETTNVTWQGTVQPLIQGRCAISGCHVQGGDGPGDFTQYANVKTSVDNGRFQAEVIQARSMPPPNGLAACEIQQLEAWIASGASQD